MRSGSDPTSLEALGRMVDRVRTLRVLLIVTFRPEFDPPWIGQSHVTALILNRLTQREVGVMIDHVVGDKPLPANTRQDIIERSDGVPLFVEEMTKAVLEAEGDRESRRGRCRASGPDADGSRDLACVADGAARPARLRKEVAQIGAAIGREFSHALLAAVARKPEAELGSALDRLIQTGLLFRRGMPPHATYQFKHALVQDAAYGALLREPRRALHARIVETLESQFAEIAERQPALLARHCTEAGLIEKAAGLWGKAGQQSLERSALVEATEQLTRALGQIEALPSTPALRREQIKLQVALTNALMHVKGFAAPETKAAEEQARVCSSNKLKRSEKSLPSELLSILYGFWMAELCGVQRRRLSRSRGADPGACRETRDDRPAHDRALLPWACPWRLRETSCEGRAHFDRAIGLYDPIGASSAGDAIWRRCSSADLVFGRIAYGCSAIPRPRSQMLNLRLRRARNWPRHHVDECAESAHR